MSMNDRRLIHLSACVIVAPKSFPAFALAAPQAAAPEHEENKSGKIEIAATNQALQKQPIIITAINEKSLHHRGAQNFTYYNRHVTELSFLNARQGDKQDILRGVNSGDTGVAKVRHYVEDFLINDDLSQPHLRLLVGHMRRSVKFEGGYPRAYGSVSEACAPIEQNMTLCRPDSSLDREMPDQACFNQPLPAAA